MQRRMSIDSIDYRYTCSNLLLKFKFHQRALNEGKVYNKSLTQTNATDLHIHLPFGGSDFFLYKCVKADMGATHHLSDYVRQRCTQAFDL